MGDLSSEPRRWGVRWSVYVDGMVVLAQGLAADLATATRLATSALNGAPDELHEGLLRNIGDRLELRFEPGVAYDRPGQRHG